MEYNWQKTLNLITNCPVCNVAYGANTAKKFINRDGAHIVHITCDNCQIYFLALIMAIGRGSSMIGMVTDLSFDDTSRLYGQPEINLDETIGAHQFIFSKEFNNYISG